MAYTQDERIIGIDTPLGKDVLLLAGFTAREGVSQLMTLDAELLSENDAINFADIIGKRVSVRVDLADDKIRYFNGFVSRFMQTGQDRRFTHYRAEIVPWLWFLTRTSDCRIFQNLAIPDIIEKIFHDLGFSDFRAALNGTYEPRDYCVQYRETDFNFVSRLMEQYGIFYFFEHEEKKHTLVLMDSSSGREPCPNQPSVRCRMDGGNVGKEHVVTSCEIEQELKPGKYALTDYNFETPSLNLMSDVTTNVVVGGNTAYEIYDYPGEYEKKPQGESLAKLRMEEEEAAHFLLMGTSSCPAFTCGYKVDLEDHYRNDLNTAYLIVEVHHTATVGQAYLSAQSPSEETYANRFTCIPNATPFRPARVTPRPFVQGVQTAVVVGPGGEEIYTDKYGRVKVQFPWDREGKKNQSSSCWIRVSHPWAGKGWGAIAIPRIGQEVIVDFLEGDPDRPIITGRVYNAERMPPYGLPGAATQSGIKSNSSKGGGGDNEIRMEDAAGSEQIYIHAQKDEDIVVEHNKTELVKNTETITIVSDRTESVGGNETLSVAKNRTRNVAQNETVTVAQNQTLTVAMNRTHTVGINEAITVGAAQEVTVGGLRTLTVGAAQATTIGLSHTEKIGVNHSEDIGKNHKSAIGNDQSIDIGGNRTTTVAKDDSLTIGKKLSITVGEQISIKTGDAMIIMKKDGTITIQGKDILIKGSGKIDVKADKDITMKGQKILQN
jgi:type VI secretion system secreted protein VgrG